MLRKIILSGIALIPIGLSRLLFNEVLLHRFDATLAGQMNVALSLGMLASLPASTAFGSTALRFIARAFAEGRPAVARWVYRHLFLGTIALSLAVAAIIWGFRSALTPLADLSERLLLQSLLLAGSYAVYLYIRNVLYAVDRVALYTKIEVTTGVVFMAVLAALAFFGLGEELLLSFCAGYLVFLVLGATSLAPFFRGGTEPGPRREILGYSGLALIGTASSLAVREVSTLFSPDAAGLEGTAHLALCLSLLTPLHFIPRTMRTVLFAESAQFAGKGDHAGLASSLSQVAHWVFVLNTPLCVGVMIAAPMLLSLAGGQVSSEAVLSFRLLLAAALLEIWAGPAANALSGAGSIHPNTWSAVVGLLLALACWTQFQLGMVGIAIGYLASSLIKSVVPMVVARRVLGVRVIKNVLEAVLLVAVSAVALGASIAFEAPALGVIAYGLSCLLVLHTSVREVLVQIRSRRARRT